MLHVIKLVGSETEVEEFGRTGSCTFEGDIGVSTPLLCICFSSAMIKAILGHYILPVIR